MAAIMPSRRTVLATAALTAGVLACSGTGAAMATTPTETSQGKPRTKPVIFVVGDSTSSAYQQSERPRAGWGQALPLLLGPQATVLDMAWSGASSKSFADTGMLDRVLELLQPGDLLLISFGHNDEKVGDPARGTFPDTTYKEYLARYVDGATSRGATPVLATPVERRRFDGLGNARDSHGAYPQAMRELAAATGTALVDLTESSLALWQSLGPEGTKSHFLFLEPGAHPQYPQGSEDNTHFQAAGALAVARLVTREMQERRIVPPGWFRNLDGGLDPLLEMYWPAERPVDLPVLLDVGPGKPFATVQSAVDAVAANSSQRTVIRIQPGSYREAVRVPSNKPRVSFAGQGARPEDVVIVYNNASGTPKPDGSGNIGTSGSASVRIDGPDFTARNLTFSNDFDEAANMDMKDRQAVALHITADRSVLANVRCLGNQDTLLVNSPGVGVQARFLFDGCHVEGDVDFIFGRGTAVFSGCEIRSLDRGSASNNGYVSAGSLDLAIPYGYLFDGCQLVSDAAKKSAHLGRPWHSGGDPRAVAQVLYRDCWLGAHIADSPWTDMSGFSWREARFHEYNNRGPGARVTADRPQLPKSAEGNFTVKNYLQGSDGWAPQLAGTAADCSVVPAGAGV